MKCDICGQGDAQNFYGIVVAHSETVVGMARYGMDITEAKRRARESALKMVRPGEFVYDVKVVCAHSRQEVTKVYEC